MLAVIFFLRYFCDENKILNELGEQLIELAYKDIQNFPWSCKILIYEKHIFYSNSYIKAWLKAHLYFVLDRKKLQSIFYF